MGILDRFKKKREINLELHRLEYLQKNGRITDGVIIDSETTEDGREIVFYFYTIQGVDFESSEILTEEQMNEPLKYAPGAKVGVKFDPKNHGNSILV